MLCDWLAKESFKMFAIFSWQSFEMTPLPFGEGLELLSAAMYRALLTVFSLVIFHARLSWYYLWLFFRWNLSLWGFTVSPFLGIEGYPPNKGNLPPHVFVLKLWYFCFSKLDIPWPLSKSIARTCFINCVDVNT